jgi:hypothetical protein
LSLLLQQTLVLQDCSANEHPLYVFGPTETEFEDFEALLANILVAKET